MNLKIILGYLKELKVQIHSHVNQKKKKNNEDNVPKVENKIKRKRKRIKIPKHVKEELKIIKKPTTSS
jgi:hypothetical protein